MGGLLSKYLLPCCFICDSLLFDMQHDHVLKKLKLDPRVGGGEWVSGGSVGKIFANLLLHS